MIKILEKLSRIRHNTSGTIVENTDRRYNMTEEYVTTTEAASIAGVTVGRVRKLLLRGRLKGRHFGRDWQVELSSLREFAASPRKPGRPRIDK
jgi:hypothetical protein